MAERKGTSVWRPKRKQYIENISKALGKDIKDAQKKESDWKSISSILVPLIASVALPGVGTMLSGLTGGGAFSGALSTLLGKTAGKGMLTKGLGMLTKSLASKGIEGITDIVGRKLGAGADVEDISIDDPLGLGKEALKQTKEDLRESIKGDPLQKWTQSLLTGLMLEGGIESFLGEGGKGFFGPAGRKDWLKQLSMSPTDFKTYQGKNIAQGFIDKWKDKSTGLIPSPSPSGRASIAPNLRSIIGPTAHDPGYPSLISSLLKGE